MINEKEQKGIPLVNVPTKYQSKLSTLLQFKSRKTE